ncbi:hypothetical protein LTS10_001740 [Elasticomyces elasticus]|nr:hypothetical protein LTS10_001740 [Elasticomyces elasticus]
MHTFSTSLLAISGLYVANAHPTIAAPQPHIAIQYNAADPYAHWPSYAELPLNAGYPTRAAWGVWGNADVDGALNHINESSILAARSEIQLGRTFNLNLPLEEPSIPINPNRKPLQHLFQPSTGYTDDVVVMNTQISTQFDGLRHFPYSTNNSVDTYQWYNDLIPDYEAVIGPAPSTVLGVQQAADKAIVGRGVLLDFAGLALAQNLTYDALHTNYSISITQLDAVAAWQNMPTEWSRPGDILFVRTGWLEQYQALNAYEQNILPYSKEGPSGGLLAADETLEWLWDKKLSLVAADNPAFESTPFTQVISGVPRSLHQIFIGGWGMSILEFVDLEELTIALHELGRWAFFVTICPMNIVSGIASPPNAIAVV